MTNWILYTKEMDAKILEYQTKKLMTKDEVMRKAKLSESTLYKFRDRWVIGMASVSKIKKYLGIDLLNIK